MKKLITIAISLVLSSCQVLPSFSLDPIEWCYKDRYGDVYCEDGRYVPNRVLNEEKSVYDN